MDEERALDPCWCGASYVLEDKTFSKHALHYGYIKKRFTCTSGHDIIVDMGRVVEVDIIPDIKKTQKAQEQNKDRKYTKPKPHFTKICQYCQKKMHNVFQNRKYHKGTCADIMQYHQQQKSNGVKKEKLHRAKIAS